jgi:hypothetical protein
MPRAVARLLDHLVGAGAPAFFGTRTLPEPSAGPQGLCRARFPGSSWVELLAPSPRP